MRTEQIRFSRRIFLGLAAAGFLSTRAAAELPDIELEAVRAQARIRPGEPTPVWTFHPTVGPLGPTLRVKRGQTFRARLTNRLLEPTVVHWHGLHVPPEMDGHPLNTVIPGGSFDYEFPIRNQAGTYWYHAHPHRRTGFQVYNGLAGFLIVEDETEKALGLPSGDADIALAIQDRAFDSRNRLVYGTGMMETMDGVLGDTILVNGTPSPRLSLATRAYRLRLLNASNARMYKLAWDDQTPMTVIGTDGGLLPFPVRRDYVTLSPGERVDIIADFRDRPVGMTIKLVSLAFINRDMGMMMGRRLPNGSAFDVASIRIDREEPSDFSLPAKLADLDAPRIDNAVNAESPRVFDITRAHMSWRLNGRSFSMTDVAPNEIVRQGTTEVWEFRNNPEQTAMAHPIHVHGVQFRVLDRSVNPRFADAWESVGGGYVDEGWKDTVTLMPGERIRILIEFNQYSGMFLYHCHNLEHEDNGMMRNYLVRE